MERERQFIDWVGVLKTTDLLQSGEIKPASKILNPEILTEEELSPMVLAADKYCHYHHFNAVAYTQFPDKIFDSVDAQKDLKNIIYFSDRIENMPLINLAIINPRFSFWENKKYHVSFEGCGSIEMGRIQMAIKRPQIINLDGYFWKQGMDHPERRNLNLFDWPSSMVQHESDHLQGKDATYFPERILDITHPNKFLLENIGLSKRQLKTLMKSLSEKRDCDFLINKKGQLLVVNYKGEFVKKIRHKQN